MVNTKQTCHRGEQISGFDRRPVAAMNQMTITNPVPTIQRALNTQECMGLDDILKLHGVVGNQAVQRMLDGESTPGGPVAGQPKAECSANCVTSPENHTGLPDQLKAGLECLSGFDLAPVRVHYNSDKPYQVGALAYTRGTDIYVAPGQEKHLSHEGWHVVQQLQGRVQPDLQMNGVAINNDRQLESEAEEKGASLKGLNNINFNGNFNFLPDDPGTEKDSSEVGSQNRQPIQCYTETTDYIIDPDQYQTGPVKLFESQGLCFKEGKYYQVGEWYDPGISWGEYGDIKESGSKGITSCTHYYDVDTHTWVRQQDSIQRHPSNPVIKVSESAGLALEATNQPRVFFINPLKEKESNQILKVKGSPLRIKSTQVGIRVMGKTLYQAAMVPENKTGDGIVNYLEDLQTNILTIQGACHDIARTVGNLAGDPSKTPPKTGAGVDAQANPGVGEAYHFSTKGSSEKDLTKEEARILYKPDKPSIFSTVFNQKPIFLDVVRKLQHVDLMLGHIGQTEDSTMLKVLGSLPLELSPTAKDYLPGWEDHSETVIAVDDPDRITMAGYNRAVEESWIFNSIIRQSYLNFEEFRRQFYELLTKKLPDAERLSPSLLLSAIRWIKPELIALINNYSQQSAATLNLLEKANADPTLKYNLWYFEMYGPNHTFHDQYQKLATRGKNTGHTSVKI